MQSLTVSSGLSVQVRLTRIAAELADHINNLLHVFMAADIIFYSIYIQIRKWRKASKSISVLVCIDFLPVQCTTPSYTAQRVDVKIHKQEVISQAFVKAGVYPSNIHSYGPWYRDELISSSSFHRLDMTLAVAEALNPNKPNLVSGWGWTCRPTGSRQACE